MKNRKLLSRLFAVGLGLALTLPVTGHAGSRLLKVTRISAPPAGKVLINFHRPSSYGGMEKLPIFDGQGTMLIDLPGKAEYQLVCEPGEHLFIAWADHVSVVKADVAPDKIYDIMVDTAPGWMRANIRLVPLTKDASRREKLEDFERREKRLYTLDRNKYVTKYEEKNQKRIEDVKRDFIDGKKSDRVSYLNKDDAR
jgi:hypothetical protein